ncbi:hypothetical protein MMC06_003471 [Schaereria dolodes]|nr:hypothetical protein [Schaereria dolodes]
MLFRCLLIFILSTSAIPVHQKPSGPSEVECFEATSFHEFVAPDPIDCWIATVEMLSGDPYIDFAPLRLTGEANVVGALEIPKLWSHETCIIAVDVSNPQEEVVDRASLYALAHLAKDIVLGCRSTGWGGRTHAGESGRLHIFILGGLRKLGG